MTARRTVRAALDRIPAEYRACLGATARGKRHDLDDYFPAPGEYRGPDWGRTFASRCVDCGTIRYITIDGLGQIANRYYVKPQRYQAALRLVSQYGLTLADLRIDHLAAYRRRMQTERDGRGRRLRAVK
jgi:hypothetical protein